MKQPKALKAGFKVRWPLGVEANRIVGFDAWGRVRAEGSELQKANQVLRKR